MNAPAHVHTPVHVQAPVHPCLHAPACVCVCLCMHACRWFAHIYTPRPRNPPATHVCMHAPVHVHTPAHVRTMSTVSNPSRIGQPTVQNRAVAKGPIIGRALQLQDPTCGAQTKITLMPGVLGRPPGINYSCCFKVLQIRAKCMSLGVVVKRVRSNPMR